MLVNNSSNSNWSLCVCCHVYRVNPQRLHLVGSLFCNGQELLWVRQRIHNCWNTQNNLLVSYRKTKMLFHNKKGIKRSWIKSYSAHRDLQNHNKNYPSSAWLTTASLCWQQILMISWPQMAFLPCWHQKFKTNNIIFKRYTFQWPINHPKPFFYVKCCLS